MYPTWILRWDTQIEEKPLVINPPGPPVVGERHKLTALESIDSAGFAVFEGYLFDKTAFLTDPDASNAACIARAYRLYGEGLFNELRGGFCLAIWDQDRKQLIAGRDAMALTPLYYYWDSRLFLLSPNIDQILAQPEVPGKFNRVMMAEYLQNIWNAHQRIETFYEDVQRLPAAHSLCLVEGNLTTTRYWDPLPPGFQWATPDEIETFPSVLERAVTRCLDVGADSLALSGGFDSVSLAVVAAGQQSTKQPLHAVSLRFDVGSADEGDVQTAVARAVGFPQVMHNVSHILKEKNIVAASLDLSPYSPLPVFGLWQSLYSGLLEAASNLGLHKVLMGTGGDEMFMVDPAYGADCLAALDLAGLWRFFRTFARASPSSPLRIARNIFWSYSTKIVLLDLIRSTLEAVSPRFTEALRSRHLTSAPGLLPGDTLIKESLLHRRLVNSRVDKTHSKSRYINAISGLAQSTNLMTHFEQSYCWAAQVGFTILYPYFDRDLVQLSLRIHPKHLTSGGYTKAPLRRLILESLPEVTLPSRKVPFTLPFDNILRGQGLSVWRELDGPAKLADLGLVAPERLLPLIEGYFAGQNNQRTLVWNILSAESWLRARTNSYII